MRATDLLPGTAFGIAAGLLLGSSALDGGGQGVKPVVAIRPYVAWSGAGSRIAEKSVLRILTVEEWNEVWKKHAGEGSETPVVDFETCMVVAVFQGRGLNSDGVEAVSVEEEAGRILFRFDDRSYQTAGPGGGAVSVTAFGLFALRRSPKPLVVEEDVQSLIGKPPLWKERARFDRL